MARDPDDWADKTKIKVGTHPTSPKPPKTLSLCDETVEDFASMFYTAAQIAKRFGVTEETLMANHADAFHAGKDHTSNAPRRMLGKLIRDFEADPDVNLARPDANGGLLLKAIETHAKTYGRYEVPVEPVPTQSTVNPLAALSELELRAQLEALGYVRKDEQ